MTLDYADIQMLIIAADPLIMAASQTRQRRIQ